MISLGVTGVGEYIESLRADSEAETEAKRLLTVPITRFFRDKKLWDVLTDILPEMAHSKQVMFNVWSAGCSGGEEAYTFSIIWQILKTSGCPLPNLRILASDINPECLSRAEKGLYPLSSLKEVAPDIKNRFFSQSENQFQVDKALQAYIRWEKRNLFEDLPDVEFDIIFLRNNLLTYYEEPDKRAAFNRIADRLKNNGLLIIGAHETLPEAGQGLQKTEYHPLVFLKTGGTRHSLTA